MSDTVFVTMYHPALGNVQVQAPVQAESLYAAHGWLLVGGGTPAPTDIAFTEALGDVRYAKLGDLTTPGTTTGDALRAAYVPKWKASTAYASGEFVLNPSGQIAQANAAFTSGTTYSSSNWTVISGGGGATVRAVYDPSTYGAVYNGTTDDHAAVQAAIDACNTAGGGVVKVTGNVKNNTTLTLKSGVTLDLGKWTLNGSASPQIALATTGSPDRCGVHGGFITSPGDGIQLAPTGGTYQLGWPRITLENVTLVDCGGKGVYTFGDSIEARLINVVSLRAVGYGIHINTTDTLLIGCTAAAGSTHGFYIQGGNTKLANCKSYGNNGRGFNMLGAGRHMLTSCEAQDNVTDGFDADGDWNTFAGCLADSNGRSGFNLVGNNNTISAAAAMYGGGGSGQVTPVGFWITGSRNIVGGVSLCATTVTDTGTSNRVNVGSQGGVSRFDPSTGVTAVGSASTTVLSERVTSDAVDRFTQTADGTMVWADGTSNTAPRRAGWFYERREQFDFGTGSPFSQGQYNFLVLGNPADPLGNSAETAVTGSSAEHGYCLHVQGFTQLDNGLSVFSRYQPYIVIGRMGIDNRFPTQRPSGYGEELALGIARSTSDYFNDIQVGDAGIRAYGPGPGAATGRYRRILLGSNDGSAASYGHSSVSVGADDVQFYRPLNLTGPAMSAAGGTLPGTTAGYLYMKVAGTRVKVPYYSETVQVVDSFTRNNATGLVAADTGQTYFITAGGWQINTNQAVALNLTGGLANAVISTAADSTIAADITPGTLHAAWLAHRVTDGTATNMLIAAVTSGASGAVTIQKKIGATFTTLASGTCTWPLDSTHRLGFQMAGNVATVTVDGTTVLTWTLTGADITTFAGFVNSGLLVFDTTTRLDNLTISVP